MSAPGLPITYTSLDGVADAPVTSPIPAPAPPELERRLAESFAIPSPWVAQPWRMFQDSPYGAFPAAASGTVSDRHAGRNLPLFWSEIDLRGFRILSRFLCDTNGFAIGFLGRLTDYHVRKGYGWQACLRGAKKTPYATASGDTDPLVAKAQSLLDQWRDANQWPVRSREAFRRWRRDGEVFARFFSKGYGRLSTMRFVEPEQVGSPTGDADGEASFGILTDDGDALDPREFCVWDLNSLTPEHEWVGADRVVHIKANVDATVKRGLPDFFPLHDQLDGVRKLLQATLATSIRQAKVAWIEQFATATGDQVRALVPQVATGTGSTTSAAAIAGQWGPWPPGTYPYPGSGINLFPPDGSVIRTEGNRQFAAGPTSSGIPSYIEVEQAVLRGASARWGMPEYFSGDASNNSFSSSLVSGSPFAVAVEGCQLEWGSGWERPVALRVLDLAVEAGLLTAAERARLDVETTEPAVVSPQPDKDTQTYTQQLQSKIVCLDTVRQKLGYDPQHEAEGVAKDAQAEAQQGGGGMPPGGPPAAGAAEDAGDDQGGGDSLAGLLGESVCTADVYTLLTEAGREGLVAKQITDKLGRKRTVYVRATPKEKPAKPDPAAAKKASAEAAHKVLSAPHEASAADVGGLVGHLAGLTVPELKDLRAKYGVGGKDRKKNEIAAALVKHALERSAAARKPAEPTPATPAAEPAAPAAGGGKVIPPQAVVPAEAMAAGETDRGRLARHLAGAGLSADKPLSLTEIAAAAGASRVAVGHVLLQMRQLGQVEKVTTEDGSDVFRPGPKWNQPEKPAAEPAKEPGEKPAEKPVGPAAEPKAEPATPASEPAAAPAASTGKGWFGRALSGVAKVLRSLNHDVGQAKTAESVLREEEAPDVADVFLHALFAAAQADDADAFESLLALLHDQSGGEETQESAAEPLGDLFAGVAVSEAAYWLLSEAGRSGLVKKTITRRSKKGKAYTTTVYVHAGDDAPKQPAGAAKEPSAGEPGGPPRELDPEHLTMSDLRDMFPDPGSGIFPDVNEPGVREKVGKVVANAMAAVTHYLANPKDAATEAAYRLNGAWNMLYYVLDGGDPTKVSSVGYRAAHGGANADPAAQAVGLGSAVVARVAAEVLARAVHAIKGKKKEESAEKWSDEHFSAAAKILAGLLGAIRKGVGDDTPADEAELEAVLREIAAKRAAE